MNNLELNTLVVQNISGTIVIGIWPINSRVVCWKICLQPLNLRGWLDQLWLVGESVLPQMRLARSGYVIAQRRILCLEEQTEVLIYLTVLISIFLIGQVWFKKLKLPHLMLSFIQRHPVCHSYCDFPKHMNMICLNWKFLQICYFGIFWRFNFFVENIISFLHSYIHDLLFVVCKLNSFVQSLWFVERKAKLRSYSLCLCTRSTLRWE